MDQETPQKQELKYPEGFENWPLEDKEAFNKLKNKLNESGIKLEIVEAQMNLAMYDESEKILKIRQDADAQYLNDYVENTVFKEQEKVDELSQEGEVTDINLDQEKPNEKEGEDNEEEKEEEENRVFDGSDDEENIEPIQESESPKPTTVSETIPVTQEKSELSLKIENANSFDELYEVLRGIEKGGIQSGDNFNSTENIIKSIDFAIKTYSVAPNSNFTNFITRAEGLRDKVGKLLINEHSASVSETETVGPVIQEESIYSEQAVPELEKSQGWEELKKLRTARAGIQNEFKKGIVTKEYLDEINTNYENARNLVGAKIKESLKKEAGENLTPEQEMELKSKINDALFDELIVKENDVYLNALREARGETVMGKALEEVKNILNTKAVKWYLGLSKKERMLVNFGVGSIAGLTFGATVAPGMVGVASYLAWRATRAVLSGSAGAVAGEWANKKWSAEELQKVEEKEIEDLKNSELSLAEKSKGLLDIEKRYRKEKIKMNVKKIGVTVGAGAGIGLLTGLAEHAVMGADGAVKSSLETKGGKVSSLVENKLAPRKGFEPAPVKTVAPVSETTHIKSAPISTEKLFDDPKVFVNEIKAGDSTWKILKDTLQNNEQFKDMSEAQKTYVLSSFSNKILQHPENYGLHNDGSINVGDKTDFTKLFEDTKEVRAVLNKAKQTIISGSAQESSIIENNEKIASWVNENPEATLTENKVSEILSSKPSLKPLPSLSETPLESSPVPTELGIPIQPSAMPVTLTPESFINNQDISNKLPTSLETGTTLTGGTALAGVATMGTLDKNQREQIHNEIAEAKQRLGQLESNKVENGGFRSMVGDTSLARETEAAFRSEIDSIYGKSGFLGMGKMEGINTKEWGEMARLPATKVVEYYTGDSTKSGLLPKDIEKLTKFKNHGALMNQAVGLMEQSSGAIKPFENENMEQFLKRLGGYVLRTSLQNLTKTA